MALAILLLPLILAGVALLVPSNRARPWLLPVAGVGHLSLVGAALGRLPLGSPTGWLVLDPLGGLVLALISVLFFLCSLYAVGYLRHREDRSNRVFCACLLVFLAMMSLVTWAHHWGLMWVAMEATTLASAPLIYFNRTARSLEATWKYLLICSVGIALALLGSFFLAYSSLHEGLPSSLLMEDLLRNAPKLSTPWLRAAFVLLLVGYGTKMGLAPMHSWKPDAYGESPGVAGALFSGGMTSCALLMVLRIYHVCHAAGEADVARQMMVFMGLVSMAVAAAFLIRQRDLKRMLAYSSVEHMGILVLGVGIGGPALYGALLHMVNNGLAKGVLFLSAGNIHRAYGGKSLDEVSGALRRLPLSGALFLAGFLAITGSPPFGPFLSEFTIARAALGGGQFLAGGLFLALLFAVFVGMGATVLAATQGRPSEEALATSYRDGWLTGGPTLVMMAMVLMLGVHLPVFLRTLLLDAVRFLEARP
ncbi:MAG TPA: proton-conducting transporter membrane subunit [Phycisphaerae bacterium]|nr:proton-conducting transporter membrane subunit [Phycisphaerae bacterium]HOJ53318.1 proton-conducting transporter membrane subunit [Phycisphaerae bacterium]HOL27204.1 proton-conducting transporter membrane subunit [Phycisphaerae bacterium]HPP21764.1 proton-conducting transporter membrane subunit [Phycisphaerae bacterium]HQA44446.1 proton-conducting transporter membrane subunit [Phycisphaerae bacterium]